MAIRQLMTVSMDADLREFVRVRKDVNWSAVAREAFRREMERLDRLDKQIAHDAVRALVREYGSRVVL